MAKRGFIPLLMGLKLLGRITTVVVVVQVSAVVVSRPAPSGFVLMWFLM